MNTGEKQDKTKRRIAACVNAFEGIPTERIEGKNLGEILDGEMRLHGAGPRADGGFGFEFSGGVCQLLAEAYAEQFKQSGAINYLELLFQHSDIGPLTITMQRVEGLTPAQRLAQAEADRDALQAKLAELEKQEPVAWLVLNSSEGYVERNPDVVSFLEAAGLTKCKPLFTRPAPAASLAELVPDEMPTSHIYHGGNGAFNAGKESGWNACRAAMLRNIEEAQ